MRYKEIASLEEFLSQVETSLLNPENRVRVVYPAIATKPVWDAGVLIETNKDFLTQVSKSANLYAIFAGEGDDDAETLLRYLGKTKKALVRQRMINHLFQKNEKTGAKLNQVIETVNDSKTIEVAWVEVHPESLRNYLEEELIRRHPEASWNRENRNTSV